MAAFNRTGVQNAYNHRTRIANWSEDQELAELRMKEFLHRKANGNLLIHQVQKHLNASLQEVGLSHSPDGYLRFGDHIMLYGAATEGVLSVDVSEKVEGSSLAYAVTTSTLTKAHVARNTWVIEPYDKNVRKGDIICLGQQFRLRANPVLLPDPCPFYLHSQPLSPLCASKISRQQLVTVQSTRSYDTVWKCAFKDGARRFEMEGEPIPANAEILLFHALTGQALATDTINYYNDFGLEYEVCAHTYNYVNKKQGLWAELKGLSTADIPARREGCQNHFAFLVASDPATEARLAETSRAAAGGGGDSDGRAGGGGGGDSDGSGLLSAKDVVAKFRNVLLGGGRASGPNALHALHGCLRRSDIEGTGLCPQQALLSAIGEIGVNLSPQEAQLITSAFLRDTSSTDGGAGGAGMTSLINYREFISRVRGQANERRIALIQQAFASVDRERAGVVRLQDMVASFDPRRHPQVVNGQVTEQQARQVFQDNLINYCSTRDQLITYTDFASYYVNVGAFVDNDDVFAHMMTNAWNIREN